MTNDRSTPPVSQRPRAAMVRALIAVYAVLFIALSWLSPASRAWGINHLQFLPTEFTIALAVAFFLFVLIPEKMLGTAADTISLLLWPSGAIRSWLVHSLTGIVLFGIFWTFRSGTMLLGDGQILVNGAAVVRADSTLSELVALALQTRTPLSTSLYFLAAQVGHFRIGMEIGTIFQLIACAGGALYVFAVLRFLGWMTESSRVRIAGLGLLLFNGAAMLFYGYIEYYTLFFLSTFIYVVLSLRSLDRARSLFLPALALLTCMAVHLAGVVLLPSFLFLALARYGSQAVKNRLRPATVLSGAGLMFAAAAAWWFLSGEYKLRDNFLPVVSLDVRNAYTLFSAEHLLDYANMLLLLCGAGCVVMVLMIVGRRRRLTGENPAILFLIIVAMFQQAFVFAANTDIGFGRDWDVMVSMGIGLVLLILFSLKEAWVPGESDDPGFARLSGAMILTFIPWLAINISEEAAARRFESLLQLDKEFVGDYRTAYGYEVLAIHARDRGDVFREQEFFGKAIEASDNIRFYENAIISLNGSAGKPDPVLPARIASRFHREVIMTHADTSSEQFQDHLSMYYVALRMMRENGLCSDALPMYREAVSGGLPSIGYALLGIAQCTAEMGEREKAAELYKNLTTSGLDIVARDWEYMGEVFLEVREFVRAAHAFEQTLAKGNATETVYFGLFKAFLGMGDKENAQRVSLAYLRTFPQGQFREAMEGPSVKR